MRKYLMPLLIVILFVVIMGVSWQGLVDEYVQLIFMYIGINLILTVSLNLINGYMKEYSVGHAAFMAVGAYVCGILTVWLFAQDDVFGAPVLPPGSAIVLFPLILIVGGIAAAIAGLLIAFPSFNTRGDYLAIVTLAVNFIVKSAIENIEVIGGPRGFMGMKKVVNAMTTVFDAPWILFWTFTWAVIAFWLVRNFVSSTYGKGIIAIGSDEEVAELMSVNTRKIKVITFMLSCGLAGIAGGLFAHILGYVNPGTFNIMKSVEMMVMVYLGGMGSLSGSFIAAVLFTVLLEVLRPLGIFKWVVIPTFLILLMIFRPSGLMGDRELTDVFPQLRTWFGLQEKEVETHASVSD
ncbi:MAG: branched-chain amino acid ABC transporter permease [Anaerolineae bacterium]|nr:branched-chain amino acid ABC transporter permease [Anaerolineae bacterium]